MTKEINQSSMDFTKCKLISSPIKMAEILTPSVRIILIKDDFLKGWTWGGK